MFVDVAGGSGGDSYTAAVAHLKDGIAALDAIREFKPPFSPEEATKEAATLAKTYHVNTGTADRYAGDWPVEAFNKHGVTIKPADKRKSDIYRELLAPLNSGKIELLDHPKLINQLCSLERRTARGGKDSIDHGPNGHDDLINSVAGALVEVLAGHSCGLFELWREQAEALKVAVTDHGSNPTPEEVGRAQKEMASAWRMPDPLVAKPKPKQPRTCPTCKVEVATYSGAWRCNCCGKTGVIEARS